jgi:hypothetical protein
VYIEPELHDALSRLADRIQHRTGQTTTRSDVTREALRVYLQQRLPDSGL